VGSYVPATRVGDLVMTSGQLPIVAGELVATGKVPEDITLEAAEEAARNAVINGLAAVASVIDGVDNIRRVVRVGVFVNSSSGFTEQAKVANGASNFLVDLLGENGKHVRAAVGVSELPLNAAVELELTVQVKI
jgi:enamine deaminase RidA (YjgF/YER057c/UK114 family)